MVRDTLETALAFPANSGDSTAYFALNKISNSSPFFLFFFFLSLIFPDGILSVAFPHFHGTSFFNGPFPALIKFRGWSPPFARVPRIFRTRSAKRCAMMDTLDVDDEIERQRILKRLGVREHFHC